MSDVPGIVVRSVNCPQLLIRKGDTLYQPVTVSVLNTGKKTNAVIKFSGLEPVKRTLNEGNNDIEVLYPAVDTKTPLSVVVEVCKTAQEPVLGLLKLGSHLVEFL